MPENNSQPKQANKTPSKSIAAQVAERINDSENVLVALSKDPSVDELSAALGLTFILDKLGKHATAIFSGEVPNAIEFLEPEKTFESNTNSLQDFIIALNKEKADHLRYKIEGDFVKVFITPYKTELSEKDLEFTHGDFNVDLIITLNVDAENHLDAALSEYGKIKHDANSINISTGATGKFADLEWADTNASSVSEMVADLAEILDDGSGEEKLVDKSTATALLAGIVAATNRFSNEHTSADTMSIASELMNDGADQQLISSSIPVDILTNDTVDVNDEVEQLNDKKEEEKTAPKTEEKPKEDPSELTIERDEPKEPVAPKPEETTQEEEASAKKPDVVPDLPEPEPSPIEPSDEIPTAPEEAPQIETTAVPAPAEAEPVNLPTPELEPLAEPAVAEKPAIAPSPVENIVEPEPHPESAAVNNEKKLTPPSEELPPVEAPISPTTTPTTPENAVPVIPAPVMNEAVEEPVTTPPVADFQPQPGVDPAQPPVPPAGAPSNAEFVEPPLPMPSDGSVLPPPPVPFEIDSAATEFDAPLEQEQVPEQAPVQPIMPAVLQEEENDAAVSPSVNGVNPVMQDQVYNDPGSFQIPGM